MREVQSATEYLVSTQTEAQSLLSKKEDANMAESISLLRNQETTYQAVLEVSQRAVSALSLFDYLK
jgi:flagellin-like hook-associated protein FlgL